VAVLGEDEYGTYTELLDIRSYKGMPNRFGEEEPSLAGTSSIVDPSEKIVQKVEQKGCEREAKTDKGSSLGPSKVRAVWRSVPYLRPPEAEASDRLRLRTELLGEGFAWTGIVRV
jgi:hypothetical protein